MVRSMYPSTEICPRLHCGFASRMIPSIAALIARSFVGMCLFSVASLKYAAAAACSRNGSRKTVAPFTTGTKPDTCPIVGSAWISSVLVSSTGAGRANSCATPTCWMLFCTLPFPFPLPGLGGGGVGALGMFVEAGLGIFGPADPMVKSSFCDSSAVTLCIVIFFTLSGKVLLRNARQWPG